MAVKKAKRITGLFVLAAIFLSFAACGQVPGTVVPSEQTSERPMPFAEKTQENHDIADVIPPPAPPSVPASAPPSVPTPARHSSNIDHNAFEATQTAVPRKETAIDAEIMAAAAKRKQAIRNTETNVEITGTSYYISANGDDCNSGLSPETPWRTISKLNASVFNTGDAVLFKRGDIFRGECLELKAGVIYSAYGEGCKPAIYGSPENGTGAEKWSLLEGTDNIWVFHTDLLECGTVVLNDSRWASKVNPYIKDGCFLMPDGSGRSFNVKEALGSDLSFYCEDDTFLIYESAFGGPRHPGKLYLRCDAGNPGEIYESIEFCPWTNTDGGKGLLYVRDPEEAGKITDLITVDNLTLKYTGGYGIYFCGTVATVQNCEIGWIGGCTTNYFDYDFFGGSGNCVGNYGDVDNYTVQNCYLYQAYDTGISSEQSYDGAGYQKHICFSGNLIEDCLFGIEFFVSDEPERPVILEDVNMVDNYVLNSGNGFGSRRQLRRWNIQDASIMFHPYFADMKDVSVTDNVLYKSGNYLILCGSENKPLFSGNTYVQDNNGGLCLWGTGHGLERGLDEYLFNETAESAIRTIIGDNSAFVAPFSK